VIAPLRPIKIKLSKGADVRGLDSLMGRAVLLSS
jgi:hypothetical protein